MASCSRKERGEERSSTGSSIGAALAGLDKVKCQRYGGGCSPEGKEVELRSSNGFQPDPTGPLLFQPLITGSPLGVQLGVPHFNGRPF